MNIYIKKNVQNIKKYPPYRIIDLTCNGRIIQKTSKVTALIGLNKPPKIGGIKPLASNVWYTGNHANNNKNEQTETNFANLFTSILRTPIPFINNLELLKNTH